MAKKKDDMDFGSEFENWESDLGDLNFDDTTVGDSDTNRSPITKVRQGITAGLTSTTKSVGPKLASKIGTEMPNTANFVGEAMQFSSDLTALKNNFTKEIQPSINQIKRAGRVLAPKFKGYLPNSLQMRLDKFLQTAEQTKQVSVEESRNAAIDQNLALIFSAQEKREQKVLEEERTDKFVDRTISATRHKELSQVVDAIRVATEFQKEFTSTIGTAYLKKSLELKFKHLFVAQDTLASVQGMAKLMEDKLEQIRHNTALPDTQKQHLTESYKEVAKAALAQRINSKFGGWGKQILSNVQEKLLDPIKQGLGMAAMTADMSATMSEMEDSMGFKESRAEKIGGLAGGIASSKAAQWISQKLFGNGMTRGLISPYASNAEGIMENLKFQLMLKAQNAADNAEDGSFKKFALSILSPNLRKGGGTIKDDLSDPFEPASFDKATRTSIVEIIPGYLAKILQQATRLATGKDTEELTYSYDKRNFVSVSEFRRDVMERAFGSDTERSVDLGRAVGAIRGAFAHHTDDFGKFDDAVEDIKKVLVNASVSNQLINPKWIKMYAEGNNVDSDGYRRYIRDIFKGIENPKAVALVLTSSLYLNGKDVNKQALTEINRYVIGLMTKDQYLSILPTYFAKTGQGRHLGDLAKATSGGFDINQEFVRERRLSGSSDDFDKELNYSATRTKDYLERDFKDKQESHPVVRQMFEWMFGKALNRKYDAIAAREFGSDFDDFFRDIYNANVDPTALPEFVGQKSGDQKALALPGTQAAQVVRIRSQRAKAIPTEMESSRATILAGTDIVLPVHLKSSDIPLATQQKTLPAPATPAVYQSTTPVVTGSLDQTFKVHADRQHPVPDLLEQLVKSNSEMNDKMMLLLDNTTGVIKSLWHRGKNITQSWREKWNKSTLVEKAGKVGDKLRGWGQTAVGWGGSAGSWMLRQGGKAVGALASLPSSMYNTWSMLKDLRKSEFENLDETPWGWNEAGKGRLARAKDRLVGIGSKIKDKFDLRFVDVYLKDKVEPGNPLLTVRQQRKGVVFSDGSSVLSSFKIDKPVLDPETNETLISQENIDHGLVDVKNRPLKVTLFKGKGSLLSKITGLFGTKDKIKSLKDMFSNDNSIAGLMNTVTKGVFGALGWAGKGLGRGVRTIFDKVTGKDGIEVRRKDLREMVGDKLDSILTYLKERFGERRGSIAPGDTDGDGRDTNHEEYLQKQAEQAAAIEKDRAEKQLEVLESIDQTTKANLALDAKVAQQQAQGEGGGGLLGSALDLLGDMKWGKWIKGLFAGGGIKGLLRGGAGRLLGSIGARMGLTGGASLLLGGGAGAGVTAGTAGAVTTAVTGTGLAATAATGAAGTAGAGGIAALLASNPIGWAVGGAVLAGAAAYGTYKWLNPSGDELLEQRAEYYGVDLNTSTGFFSGSYKKKVLDLEEITAEILQGKEQAFGDKELAKWAEEFGFNPKKKEEVKYFATWYRQRFYPTFRIFLDLVKKAGGEYDTIDDLSAEAREAISMEFQKQVGNNVTTYKELVPTMEGFKKFQKKYEDVKSRSKTGEPTSEADRKELEKAAAADFAVTKKADQYGLDKAAVVAAKEMSWDSNSPSPTEHLPKEQVDKKSAWGMMTQSFGTPGVGGPNAVEPIDISGYTPKLPQSGELGALSAKYESSKLGSMAIGYDSTGGTSYGTYQIASKTGTFANFLQWLKRQGPEGATVAERLYRAGVADTGSRQGAVPNEWRLLVKEGKMKDFEHQFIKATHYDVALNSLVDPEMKSMIEASKALQDVLWSTSVQHGPGGAKKIFNKAWASLQQKTPEAFIKAIYTVRSGNFPSSTPQVQQSVKKRFGEEAATAIAMLNKEKTSPDTAVAAVGSGGSDVAGLAAAESKSLASTSATAVAEGPKIKSDVDTGTDMSPAAISNVPTAPVSAASTSSTPIATPAVVQTDVTSGGGDPAISQLVKLNAGIDQVNMTLKAILLGQGVLNDINSGLQNGFTSMVKNANVAPTSPEKTNTQPVSSGYNLHSARSLKDMPVSVSVHRASANI